MSEQVEKKGQEIALQWKRAPKIGATVAVAADPALLPLPSKTSSLSPPAEEAELLAGASTSDPLSLLCSSLSPAAEEPELLAAGSDAPSLPSSALSLPAEAADRQAETAGSETPSLNAVSATEGSVPLSDSDAPSSDSSADAALPDDLLASGSDSSESLSESEDIAGGPRPPTGARTSSPKEGYGG